MTKEALYEKALATLPPQCKTKPANAYEFWQAFGGHGRYLEWVPNTEVKAYLDMVFPEGATKHESIPAPPGSPMGEPYPYAGFGKPESKWGASTKRNRAAPR